MEPTRLRITREPNTDEMCDGCNSHPTLPFVITTMTSPRARLFLCRMCALRLVKLLDDATSPRRE